MLSKEEYTPIELREHCIKTMQFSKINSNAYKEHELILSILDENISMKYKLDQLESDKQKLIEKLEKDIREETGYAKWTNSYTKEISPAVTKMISKSKYAQEILSILKGGNRE